MLGRLGFLLRGGDLGSSWPSNNSFFLAVVVKRQYIVVAIILYRAINGTQNKLLSRS